ncbi:MAG: AarF/ABC1/UbiB kinase family protein [SAR324 cluster bacterium]|nr:AarF/ABC1/UbiB kinase family protein [SAR324 cluster bacterium]MBF0352534.1 AarF/ABC1/UbiB kinase family protein [SAR324 cluster bacterium]
MPLDKLFRSSKRFLEEIGQHTGQWLEEVISDPKLQKVLRELPFDLGTQMSQVEQQLMVFLSGILPENLDVSRLFEQVESRFKQVWLEMGGIVQFGDRYVDAVQVIMSIVIRTRLFQYYSSRLNEEEKLQKEALLHEKNAIELTDLCKRQKGAWIKAAQFLSCRADWLPLVYLDHLGTLQDQAPATEWIEVEKILVQELGAEWEQMFLELDRTPVATASIAQVHKGILKRNNQPIALKIQHPDVSAMIKADLKFFQMVSQLVNRVEGIDVKQFIKELSRSILLELDYYQEARNLNEFCSSYRKTTWKFPLLIPELLTTRTLGMEFVEGMPVRDFLKNTPGVAPLVLKELVGSFMQQIFSVGIFHADPHPGNFFVTPTGQIAILDYGALGRLTPQETSHFQKIMLALLFHLYVDYATILTQAGFHVSDPQRLNDALHNASVPQEGLLQLQFYLQILKEVEVEIPDSFILMIRVLISLGGLLAQYQVKLDFQELASSLL